MIVTLCVPADYWQAEGPVKLSHLTAAAHVLQAHECFLLLQGALALAGLSAAARMWCVTCSKSSSAGCCGQSSNGMTEAACAVTWRLVYTHLYYKCNSRAEHGNRQRCLPPTDQFEAASAWPLVDAVTGAANFAVACVPDLGNLRYLHRCDGTSETQQVKQRFADPQLYQDLCRSDTPASQWFDHCPANIHVDM